MKKGISYLKDRHCGNRFVHNNRSRYSHGFQCSDCGRFIHSGTLEHFMTSAVSSIWMALHNRRARFNRGESKDDLNDEMVELMNTLDDYKFLLKLTEIESKVLMENTYRILEENKVNENEATIGIS